MGEIIISNSIYKKKEKKHLLLIRLKYLGFQKIPIITNLKRISRPCLRIYSSSQRLPKVLCGFGSSIVSNSGGFMLDREARARSRGGEVILSIWLFRIIKLCV